MAGETHSDRIRELEQVSSALVARADRLQRDVVHVDAKVESTIQSLQDLDKRFAVLANKVDRIEKQFDELSSRRWDILKIVVSSVVGALLTLAGFLANAAMDRR